MVRHLPGALIYKGVDVTEQDALTYTPEQFQSWRAAMGWSQKQAAIALGCNRSSVIDWEAGRYPVGSQTVLACQAYRAARFMSEKTPDSLGDVPGMLAIIAHMRMVDGMQSARGRPRKPAQGA